MRCVKKTIPIAFPLLVLFVLVTVRPVQGQANLNVLKYAVVDRTAGTVALIADWDGNYRTGGLPYDDWLATALDSPDPAFSLEWTPESDREIDRFFAQLDQELARFVSDPAFRKQWTDRILGMMYMGGRLNEAGYAMMKIFTKEFGISENEFNALRLYMSNSAAHGRDGLPYGPALDAYTKMFTGVGKPQLTRLMHALIQGGAPALMQALGPDVWAYAQDLIARRDRGELPQAQMERLGFSKVSDRWLEMMDVPYQERRRITSAIEGGSVRPDYALLEVIPKRFGEMVFDITWQKLVEKGLYFPPALLEALYGVRPPLMRPRFIQVPAGSRLARTLYEADLALKQISELPETRDRVPDHLTRLEWVRRHLSPQMRLSRGRALRMWLSPGKIDLDRSPDGSVLAFQGVALKVNSRVKSGTSEVDDPETQGYADYLQARYETYARAYPPLHELREAAKVVALAKWLKRQGVTVPMRSAAPVAWQPPYTVKGFLHDVTFEGPTRDTVRRVVVAAGGVSLQRMEQAFNETVNQALRLPKVKLSGMARIQVIPLQGIAGVEAPSSAQPVTVTKATPQSGPLIPAPPQPQAGVTPGLEFMSPSGRTTETPPAGSQPLPPLGSMTPGPPGSPSGLAFMTPGPRVPSPGLEFARQLQQLPTYKQLECAAGLAQQAAEAAERAAGATGKDRDWDTAHRRSEQAAQVLAGAAGLPCPPPKKIPPPEIGESKVVEQKPLTPAQVKLYRAMLKVTNDSIGEMLKAERRIQEAEARKEEARKQLEQQKAELIRLRPLPPTAIDAKEKKRKEEQAERLLAIAEGKTAEAERDRAAAEQDKALHLQRMRELQELYDSTRNNPELAQEIVNNPAVIDKFIGREGLPTSPTPSAVGGQR